MLSNNNLHRDQKVTVGISDYFHSGLWYFALVCWQLKASPCALQWYKLQLLKTVKLQFSHSLPSSFWGSDLVLFFFFWYDKIIYRIVRAVPLNLAFNFHQFCALECISRVQRRSKSPEKAWKLKALIRYHALEEITYGLTILTTPILHKLACGFFLFLFFIKMYQMLAL